LFPARFQGSVGGRDDCERGNKTKRKGRRLRRVERGKSERAKGKNDERAGHLLPLFSCFEVGHACREKGELVSSRSEGRRENRGRDEQIVHSFWSSPAVGRRRREEGQLAIKEE